MTHSSDPADISAPSSPNPQPSTNHRIPTKRRGEIAEAAFLLKASSLGFSVAKPWGDSDRYDFILDNGDRTWRVQVKTASMVSQGAFSIHACGSVPSRTYTPAEIDFLVAYIVSEEIWYVLPVDLFTRIRHVKFHPFRRHTLSSYEKYREAWCLMACPKDAHAHSHVQVHQCCEVNVCEPDTGVGRT